MEASVHVTSPAALRPRVFPRLHTLTVLVASAVLAACSTGGGTASSSATPAPPGTSATSASPTGAATSSSGAEGQLLFSRTTGRDEQSLYLATAIGERQISEPGEYCCVFRVSPQHDRVLVLPGGDISPPVTGGTVSLDGTDFHRLTPTDAKLNLIPTAWSPHTTRFACLGWDDTDPSRRGIYISNLQGGDLRRVTVRPGQLDDIPLDFSPDGQQLVFYRSAHPDPDPHTDGSLWVVNIDGTGAHRITKAASPPADSARWSPDGKRILFADQRTAPTGAVWTVAPDGSHLTKVFADSQGRFPLDPLWSPDGSHILLALDPTNDAFKHPNNGLYTITDQGTQPQLVVGTADFKAPADWWQ